jgi:hypothetical protein
MTILGKNQILYQNISDLPPFSPVRSTFLCGSAAFTTPGIATSFSLGKRACGETWQGFLGKRYLKKWKLIYSD